MHHKMAVTAVTVSLLLPLCAVAQLADRPTAIQAPLILSALDKDGDDKISRSEAPDQLKQNFTFVDRNGDGGIDLAELKAALKLAANRPGSDRTAKPKPGTAESNLPAGGFSFGTLNAKQAERMRSLSPEEDRPFYMLNLIKYRERAVYPDGRETDLTGREADNLYAPIDFLAKIGAEVAYVGAVQVQQGYSKPNWETVGIVRYPSRAKFFQMAGNREFQARSIHKQAGVEVSQVIVTERVPWPGRDDSIANDADAPFPATDEDAAFTLLHLVKYRDVAQYPDGSEEPQRSGREAMALYEQTVSGILNEVGARPIMKLNVEGVFIGDGRDWSECRLIHFPSQRAFREAAENARLQSVRHHRAAAIEDSYTLQLNTQIDRTGQLADAPTEVSDRQSATLDTSPTIWAKPQDKFRDEYGIFAPIDANMVGRRFPATTDFPTGPEIGERLPECRLPNQHGDMIDLHASLKGKKGVVVFYRSTVW